MRLVFSTNDFIYSRRPRPGFPLILDSDMRPLQPFHDYLRWLLLDQGISLDIQTWESYGRYLWDFASFLHANGFSWDQPFESRGKSVLRVYRDWQAEDLKLDPAYRNKRLRIVQGFYEWAKNKGMIAELPYSYDDITGKSNLTDVEWNKAPVFLTAEQIKVARSVIRATEHRLAFDLMTRVGLRSIETRTFPLKYVFDPSARRDLKPRTLIPVSLDPRDMKIKYGKSRVVHVPYSLMQDMHTYSQFERNRRLSMQHGPKTLLLTAHGNAYSKGSMIKIMQDLGKKVDFSIRPLMLRHSYAIHTLLFLKRHPTVELEPLMYVRDRLGHEHVQTTMIYLEQIDRLMGAEAMAIIEEFDRLYDVTSLQIK